MARDDKKDFNFVAGLLASGIIVYGLYFFIENEHREQDIDLCMHQMTFEAANADGYYVDIENVGYLKKDGIRFVQSSASLPIFRSDTEGDSISGKREAIKDSTYLIRCSIHKEDKLIFQKVEKFKDRQWMPFRIPKQSPQKK